MGSVSLHVSTWMLLIFKSLTITCLYCIFSSSSLSLSNQVNSYSQTWQLLEQDVKC